MVYCVRVSGFAPHLCSGRLEEISDPKISFAEKFGASAETVYGKK